MTELRLFGQAQLLVSAGQNGDVLTRQPKRLAVLAYLAIASPREGGLHRRDKLVGLFWPELDAPHARNALSQALHVIRRTVGDDAIVTRGDDEVGLATDVISCDVIAFERALDEGRPKAAVALYRGDFLDGFFVSGAPEFERWVDEERERLRHRASQGAWSLAQSEAKVGALAEAGRWARVAANLVRTNEAQLRQLMTFLSEIGDRAGAIRSYEQFVHESASEYQLEPSSETKLLATSIRRHELPSAPYTATGVSPPPLEIAAPRDSSPSDPVARPPSATRRRLLPWIAGLAAAAAVVSVAGLSLRAAERGDAAATAPRLVVLPFQNLGSPDNIHFAEGISDEIATRLAMVRGLNVVGGPTARRYKRSDFVQSAGGRTLAADYLLSGTTSWEPREQGRGHLRVRLQLVRLPVNTLVWGAMFDKDVVRSTELFAFVSEVAARVVEELDIALAPGSAPTTIPTTNLEAYGDFLRGRQYLARSSTPVNYLAAIRMLERAVARDTAFALGFAWLANAHTEAQWNGGLGIDHYDAAHAAGMRALALDPNLAEAHKFMGQYFYACCEDYERAMWYLTKSHALRPGDWQTEMFLGNVYKRQGRFAESIEQYRVAERLDPFQKWPRLNLAQSQMWMRRYDDAERTFKRAIAAEPPDIWAYAHLAWLMVLRDGDVTGARRVLADAARYSDGYAATRIPYYLALLDRNYDEALTLLRKPEPSITSSLLNDWLISDPMRSALVYRLQGDSARARLQFQAALVELDSEMRNPALRSRRNVLLLRSGLAVAHAGLGRDSESTRESDLVVRANPLGVDAIEGPRYLQHVALAHALLGHRDAAINTLSQLLSVAAPVTRHALRLEPFWDPLREDPRFVQLLRGSP